MTKENYILSIKRNSQRLYLIALSFTKSHCDAEDILQNVFLKLWKNNSDFESDEHIDKWLTKVCVNESKNFLKLSFRKSTFLDEAKDIYTFDKPQNYDVFSAVMSLSKKDRTVVHLFYYEDMSVKDIANLLKIKESTVKIRLHRARLKLKNILGDEWIYE